MISASTGQMLSLRSLPQELAAPLSTEDRQEDGISEKARKVGLARHALLIAWNAYRQTHLERKTTDIDREFLAGYNACVTYKNLYVTLGEVSRQTLYRWKQMLGDTNDWTRLVPQYSRQQGSRLNPVEEKIFLGFLLTPNKIPVGTAIRFTKLLLEQRGYKTDKSDMTFRRYADDFMDRKYDTWVLMREGQKALKDKVSPHIKRDPSVLDVGDALVADGHRLNFQVINPFTGKPCRGTIIAYVDWKSFDLAGYELMINENTQVIASAMRHAIINLGKMPKVSYQDNGKAFKSRFFMGSPSFEESGLYGLFGRLGIVPVFAAPYNARAKIVERWFKEFSNTFERLFPSFIGSSIADKPAYMMRNEKFHKALHNEYIPTIEESVQLIDAWLQFHRAQECPHVKGTSIGDVFSQGRGAGVRMTELDDLMMDAKITRIDRNGIRFLGQDYYDENLYGLKEQVVIKYSLFDLAYIKVYAMSGEFLCVANRVMSVHPLARALGEAKDVEAVKQGIRQQRRLSQQTIKLAREYTKAGTHIKLDWQKVTEVTPRVVERLEQENIALPATEEHIPDEAVQSVEIVESMAPEVVRLEPQTKPIFQNNIDRYEWHLKHGIFTEEDETWCVWFRTTDDFRMLFLSFQSQSGQ